MEETQAGEVSDEIPFELDPQNGCFWAERDDDMRLDADKMHETGMVRCRFIARAVHVTRCLNCRRYQPL